MKTKSIMSFCIGAVLSLMPADAQARAIDDAKFIMDVRGDLNGNAQIDAGELGSALDVSSASPVSVKLHVSGSEQGATPPTCTNMFFASPFHPMTTNMTPCIYFHQSNYYDADGINFVSADSVVFKNAAVKTATQTAYMRFRWDGSSVTNYASNCWLFLSGYSWSPASGWGVFITQGAGLNTNSGTLGYMVPMSVMNAAKAIDKNVWYDLFVTIKPVDGTNSVFNAWIWRTPKTKMYTDETPNRLVFDLPTVNASTFKNVSMKRLTFGDANNDIRIGCESDYAGYTAIKANNNNAAKSFRGAISRMMFWDRELTEDEMTEISSGFPGAIISAGAVNGSADEFSDDNPTEIFSATNAWRELRKTLTEANPSITLKGSLPKDAAGYGQVLSVAPIFSGTASQHCMVQVEVNGTSVGMFNLKQVSGRNIFIPGKFMIRDANGMVTVKITRQAPFAETLQLDAVSLGGSWCVGEFNNSHGELERESAVTENFFVGDADFKHVTRAMHGENQKLYCSVRIHSYLPNEGENRSDGVFRLRTTIMAGGISGHAKLDLWVNDVCVTNLLNVTSSTTYDINIPVEDLKSGMNVFCVSNSITKADMNSIGVNASYVCFDAFRFILNPAPNGTILIFR